MDVLCAILLVALAISANSQYCTSPQNSIRGVCISLYDCPILLQAFDLRPMPSSLVSFLKRSQCGFEGYVPKVCCSNSININDVTNAPQPTQQRPRPKPPTYDNQYQNNQGFQGSQGGGYSELLPADCGMQGNDDRIYNGEITDIDEFPWMALLGYRTNRGQIAFECGGVLISHRYVLTAGHCVVGEVNTKVGKLQLVRLGEYNLDTDPDCVSSDKYLDCNEGVVDVPVEQIIAHPGFSDQNVNRKDDIALLRLSNSVKFTDFIKPICLPTGNVYLPTGDKVVVSGWGKTLQARHSQVKLKLEMPVYDRASCFKKYAEYNAILTDKQLCAGGEYARDACFGDSGGPLMKVNPRRNVWTSVGIVSFGNGCGKRGWPGVYTSVDKYMGWIRQNLRP